MKQSRKPLNPEERRAIAALGGIQKGKNYAARRAKATGARKRLTSMSPESRRELAQKAARARWEKKRNAVDNTPE